MSKTVIKFPILATLFIVSHFIPLYIPLLRSVWYILLLSCFVLVVFHLIVKKIEIIFEILIAFIFIFFGAFRGDSIINPQYSSKSLFSYQFDSEVAIEGVIIETKSRENKTNYIVDVKKIYKNLSSSDITNEDLLKSKNSSNTDIIEIDLEGKIGLFLSWSSEIKTGKRIVFRAKLELPPTAQNYGEFDYRGFLKTVGVSHVAFLKNSFQIKKIDGSLFFIDRARLNIKSFLEKNLAKYDKNGIFQAVLLGEKTSMESQFKERLVDGGMIHLFTISGFHIAIFYMILNQFFLFLLRLNIRVVRKISIKKWAISLSLIVILIYIWILGFQIASFRAFLMLSIFGIAKIFDRNSSFIYKLMFSAFIITLLMPHAPFSIGFYLSFSAVLGIFYAQKFETIVSSKIYIKTELLLLKKQKNKLSIKHIITNISMKYYLSKLYNYLLKYAIFNLFIWLTTLPFLLFIFYKAPFGQFLWNLIFIPFFSFIFYPALLIAFLISFFIDINYIFNLLDTSIVKLSYLLDFGGVWYQQLSLWQLIGTLLSLLSFGLFLKYKNRKFLIFSGLYFLFILFPNVKSGLNIYVLSIGNGDAIVIEFPNGKTAMIDAGPKVDGSIANRVIIPHLTYFGVKKIDYFFLSHPDEDHYGGIFRLVEKNIVSEVITSKFEQMPDFLTPIKIVEKPESINIGSVELQLFPENSFPDKNNNSLIILLKYQNRKILFTGDAEEPRESLFIEKNIDIKNIDILKVGHHGSKGGSSAQFLQKLNPKYSIISSGYKNRFGHPHKDTIERLQNVNTEIFRTDVGGVVEINIESKSLKISTPFFSHKR